MNQTFINQIVQCIKTDNNNEFSLLLKQKDFLRATFGRFPLLSVLYLFNASKLIKKYEKDLILISEFENYEENVQIYNEFKQKSGRLLRLYAVDSIVTPCEMLAVLNQNTHLNYVIKKYNLNIEKIIGRINQIELVRSNSETTTSNKKIKFGKKKLSNNLIKAFISCVILIFLTSAVAILSNVCTKNWGTENNPLVISNSTQLKMALESDNKFYKLNKNIKLSLNKSYSCSSNIDGNGKIITITNSNSAIFDVFSGKIYNATIIFEHNSKSLNKNFSSFANINEGEISNINLKFDANINLLSVGESIFVSAFVGVNNNKISDCSVLANVNVNGTANVDTFFTCVASQNNNEIKNCIVKSSSVIITNTTDVCGIVSQNNADGKINNCSNFGTIAQNTSINTWTPNVAGINLINYGLISNCINNSELKITTTSNVVTGETATEGFCAGICAVNYKKIENCKNVGKIEISNTNYNIYAGGIVALNYFNSVTGELSEVSKCAFSGTIQLTDSQSNSYIGGIAGCSVGYVKDSYSILTVSKTESVKFGGIIGLTHYGIGYNGIFGFVYVSTYAEWYDNNYFHVTNQEFETKTGIAGILPNTALLSDVGMNICNSEEEIKDCEVFW